ncbi:glycan-binding surface protein [Longitalea luteola]|uniref:glycan-binding surface protein n=1 Tax=Longitalea luteola TaxID=2812563 RepID=UPI001A96BF8B|nr:glycan-binding surface protein [Longitalea luteola]
MKKILYRSVHCCLLLCLIMASLPGCKKETSNAPVITGVRNFALAPGDSIVNSLIPGQWIVLLGHNLKGATQIYFNGVVTSFNSALFSDTSAAVQVPSVIPFPSIAADQLNTIRYITPHGSTTFTFNIVAPPPTIESVSNENAQAGDSVRVYGLNFFFIKNITFAGSPVTSWKEADDGTSFGFVVPSLSQSAPLVITTESGTAATVYNMNDVTTGALCNFDDVNTYSWGATGTSNSNSLFSGNRGYYAILQNGNLNANEWSWWNTGRSINTNGVQWVPADSLNVPIGDYALKFEVNAPAPWNGGSIYVVKDYSTGYVGRYEPWKDADGNTSNYSTAGWRTVTIPLSMFLKNNGTGTAASSLTELLGSSGSGSVNIWLINNSPAPTATGTSLAFDNIRVVKIR